MGCALLTGCGSLAGPGPGVAASVVAPASVPAPASAATFVGRATDPATGRLLYTETHTVAPGGERETVRYTDAAGESLGEKTLDYAGHPYAPLYRLTLGIGYAEAVTARSPDGRALTLVRGWGGDERTGTVTTKDAEPLLVDAGIERFIADRLPALARGEEVGFRAVVVPRFEAYGLGVVKQVEATVDDRPALTVEASPDALFLRLLVEPARLTFDLASRRLRRYEGPVPIRDPDTGRIYRHVRVDYGLPVPEDRKAGASAGAAAVAR